MPDAQGRTTEAEFSNVVLLILANSKTGSASFAELIEEIPQHIKLTASDYKQSDTRPNEPIWHQRVRNIKSHKDAEGNYIAEGLLDEIPSGLRITDAGRATFAQEA